jgi:hypothetical protein
MSVPLTLDGKAVAGPVEQGAGPERRRYIITDEGVDVQRAAHPQRMREAVRHGQHAHGGDTTSAATAIERDTSTISTLTGAKL